MGTIWNELEGSATEVTSRHSQGSVVELISLPLGFQGSDRVSISKT